MYSIFCFYFVINISMEDIKSKLAELDDRLSLYISRYFWKPVEEIRAQLADNLTKLNDVLPKEKKLINDIEATLTEKTKLETDQKTHEENEKFLQIEKEVLASLPEAEQKRITTMRQWLQNNYWERYETSYKQAIMKLYKKEVVIRQDSVQFLYAHKELYKQELQLSKDGDIFDYPYEDFDGKNIARREIKQKVLDKDNSQHHYIQKTQEQLQQEGKYIATEENTFNNILNWFEWDMDQKIKAMQFLTGFIGRWIISLEKDKNDCRRFLESTRYESYTDVCDYNDPNNYGSLFVAKDC